MSRRFHPGDRHPGSDWAKLPQVRSTPPAGPTPRGVVAAIAALAFVVGLLVGLLVGAAI